jgi:hypothetical protein
MWGEEMKEGERERGAFIGRGGRREEGKVG